MAFVVSNVGSPYIHSTGLKLEKAIATADVPAEEPSSSPDSAESTPARSVPDRYRISPSHTEMMAIQEEITRSDIAKVALKDMRKALDSLPNPSTRAERIAVADEIDAIASSTALHREKLFGSRYPNRSSDPGMRPVTVEEPPKPGRYTVSVLKNSTANDGESISYSISVKQAGTDIVRTIETSISPATGLIQGIALHFDQPPPAQAEIIVAASGNRQFPLPAVEPETENLRLVNDKDSLAAVNSLSELIDSTGKGIQSELAKLQQRFTELGNTVENMAAMEGGDLSSAASALRTVVNSRMAMVRNSGAASKMYTGISPEQAENLLKE